MRSKSEGIICVIYRNTNAKKYMNEILEPILETKLCLLFKEWHVIIIFINCYIKKIYRYRYRKNLNKTNQEISLHLYIHILVAKIKKTNIMHMIR